MRSTAFSSHSTPKKTFKQGHGEASARHEVQKDMHFKLMAGHEPDRKYQDSQLHRRHHSREQLTSNGASASRYDDVQLEVGASKDIEKSRRDNAKGGGGVVEASKDIKKSRRDDVSVRDDAKGGCGVVGASKDIEKSVLDDAKGGGGVV
jgi:hypothetical protein